MLSSKRQLIEATDLTVAEVRAAMGRGSYPDTNNEIKFASFEGMSPSGNFVYRIGFKGETGRNESGNVYLKFVQTNNRFVLEATN
jgi:hypothetical protein